jgi:hypothetical protein
VTSTTYSDFQEAFCDLWLSIVNHKPTTLFSDECRRRVLSSNPIVTMGYVLHHPNGPWEWGGHFGFRGDQTGLLSNPNMTSEFLLHHLDSHPEWGKVGMIMLSRHRCLTQEILLTYPHLEWDMRTLAMNPRVSHAEIKKLPTSHPICKPLLGSEYIAEWSRNSNLSLDHVRATPQFSWAMSNISRNMNLQAPHAPDIISQYSDLKWNVDQLSLNPSLTWEIIQNHPELEWNRAYLSHCKIIPLEVIENNTNVSWAAQTATFKKALQWEWGDRIEIIYEDHELYQTSSSVDGHGVSNHPNITWDFILRNREKSWSLDALSGNPHLIPDFAKMWKFCPDWNSYDWGELSAHPHITWDVVQSHPDLPWDYRGLSVNPNITAMHRKEHPEIIRRRDDSMEKTYWHGCNPNLTLDEIPNLLDKTHNFLGNPLKTNRIKWIDTRRLQHIAALRISRFARDILYNPAYSRSRRYLTQVWGLPTPV